MASIEKWKEHFRHMAQKGHTHEDYIFIVNQSGRGLGRNAYLKHTLYKVRKTIGNTPVTIFSPVAGNSRFKNETNVQEKAKKNVLAESLEDMAILSMHQYLSAKHMRRKERLYQNALLPIDYVLHSLWSGCDIMMNGELVSTTNQKYVYKSYFENILNNSHSTKNTN